MAIYNIITTVNIQEINPDGTTTIIPAGYVINRVYWDGVSAWESPANTILQLVSE